MPDPIAEYIAASDNASDYADAQAKKLEQRALEDIDDLTRNPERRDTEFWAAFDVNEQLTVADYEAEPVLERGPEWSLGLAGIYGASRSQFVMDNREALIIKPAAYRQQVMSRFSLTHEQLVAAGKRGFPIENNPYFEEIQLESYESVEDLRGLNNTDLYTELLTLGAVRDSGQVIVTETARTSYMLSYPPESIAWQNAASSVVNTEATKEVTSMTRRSLAAVYAVKIKNILTSPLVVWIIEGGKNTCGNCLNYAGQVHTYEEWANIYGLPGAEVCRGLDRCRCNLDAV